MRPVCKSRVLSRDLCSRQRHDVSRGLSPHVAGLCLSQRPLPSTTPGPMYLQGTSLPLTTSCFCRPSTSSWLASWGCVPLCCLPFHEDP